MKRSPMTRTAPRPAAEWTGDTLPTARAQPLRIADTRARLTVPLPKNPPLRSEPYRRWVAAQPCAHCGRAGPSQAAHSDTGKGVGIKSCDSTAIPLCADGHGRQGCHAVFGASGLLGRVHRRHLESTYVQSVQDRAKEEGAWPKGWTI